MISRLIVLGMRQTRSISRKLECFKDECKVTELVELEWHLDTRCRRVKWKYDTSPVWVGMVTC